ncbi:fimbrial protein [Scandinavium manionii]|uniref:fimbrial protein n=1 Tax=Scandinavium manionii TaxID=2926520 RepID=UPI0021658624|nr:fimbrial protein [Scandinavium manionii]MCS2167435.1 fimbrial protein [Scandinavium manionii]
MRKYFFLCIILFVGLMNNTWAVDCYQNHKGGKIEYKMQLPTFTVPSDAVLGAKIWESPDFNITVYCDNAAEWHSSNQTEELYAWINLTDASVNDPAVINNPYFTFGVTYNGVDHESLDEGINTNECLDKYESIYDGIYHDPVCNGQTLQKSTTFNARVRLYVKLKAIPPDPTAPIDFGEITVVQFDGEGGANLQSNAKNLRFKITGLDNIHFLDCSVDIRIEPENQIVDFGDITTHVIKNQSVNKPFTISTVKDSAAGCTQQFDVESSFYTDDNVINSDSLDMGNGLLMRIINASNGQAVEYNQYENFATYDPATPGTGVVSKNYTAELRSNPNATVSIGPFSKDVIFKINYH